MQNLLKWLISAPVLVEGEEFLSTQAFSSLFESSKGQKSAAEMAEELAEYMSKMPPSRRKTLGGLFEWLIAGALAYTSGAELLGQSIQVREAAQTVGEMDFIIKHRGEVVHLEAAVKFYLALSEDVNRPEVFVGTNKQDTMARKLTKLRQKQLKIMELPAALEALRATGLPRPQKSVAVVKGQLFYPFELWRAGVRASWASHDHLRGWWMEVGELEKHFPLASLWLVAENKQGWLVVPGQAPGSPIVNLKEVCAMLRAEPRPTMIHAIEGDFIKHSGFVVPLGWGAG